METVRRCSMSILILAVTMLVMEVTEVESVRIMVGGAQGWGTSVNYTTWAQDKHFYNGDWLFFVYDRNQLNVNSTDYESCNSDHPLHNWTTGAGRDVVPLNVTRKYYFISGKGFCYGGAKLAVDVENPPPPPEAAPVKADCTRPIFRGHFVVPAVFAIAAMWDSLIFRLW
ncbi:LOW QUALITY PROTEIN: Phytocyanin domain [Dillenia turbinata]|uniref:Phytocyanin domain n=1 Tax=Dillenia turbinata TaxID=194707 RepID=A0AAN8V625_9MAGN